jgi:hypothetical protein
LQAVELSGTGGQHINLCVNLLCKDELDITRQLAHGFVFLLINLSRNGLVV